MKSIMVIGGTSGIGLALARHYVQRGDRIAICGRDLQRLPADVHDLVGVASYQLDIADRAALSQAIDDFAVQGLDMLIVTAGIYYNTRSHLLDEAATLHMLRTNVSGLSHAFELATEKMLLQKSGQLVAISSVAGLLHDYPGASVYSATKRNVLSLCDTYRIALKPFAIAVTAIVPGYIDTEKLRALNEGNASHKLFIMSEQKAVALIVEAIAARRDRLVFPWQMKWLIALLNLLPRWVLKLRK
ncbi:SDR family NAD(P)-dependent oxidoreductase [Undibacterium umbellatum]|uniref:SDR family NAD(P)-dependent oxidoreductase n=1 Tax=Undibacterium umbellatum TaxID=2762300 RepID=A0ABR6ZA53_9BURK|nr:SDR family NAD(P)-dependent oxidoreductase [Undibacterium umbellatum]MBC3908630.1 SDR family NAD(P)-dependent oxidoreductase [Undibacterium umbellatum]